MSNQLYKVRLASGFNAKSRNRAGLSFHKNQTSILELTDEQLAALKEDVWFVVEKAPKDAEATEVYEAPTNTVTEDAASAPSGADKKDEEETDPYEGVSFKDLKTQATEAGLDIKGLKSRADVIGVLEAAKNQDPAGGTAYEEHVEDGIRYFKDGDKICAVEDDNFENLEESLAGFGETEEEALAELRKAQELAEDLDEEEVEISEDMTVDELKELAGKVGLEDLDQYTEDNKADLIKAIEEASAKTEE